jgi:phosphoglycolate phosphatase-like HAD superfamily hydrolase
VTNTLVLWDIDRTLLDSGGVGGEVFRDAFAKVTGRTIDRMADAVGRTEPVIFRETLALYDLDDPDDLFPRFVRAQAEGYRDRVQEMRRRGRALPGAREALELLAGLDGVVQTVLTGNPRSSAETKLEAFQLAGRLDLESGAYGTDDPVRSNLVAIAQLRAGRRHGRRFDRATTIVIGDTTRDVEAALTGGARIIAVASGRATAQELRDAGAPIVLTSLEDTATLTRGIIAS